jgi:uncharacterized protein (DUF1810 family)
MTDPFDLQRFLVAQNPVMERVMNELWRGRKETHWMWFVFPQIAGLGMSETSRRFAIRSAQEAAAYLAHPVLGPRLTECCRLLTTQQGKSAHDIFGSPDDMKLRSSMTLFASVEPDGSVFAEVLDKYFSGKRDPATQERLISSPQSPAQHPGPWEAMARTGS